MSGIMDAFGPGIVIGTRTDLANATPINLGFAQELSMDFQGNIKELTGQNQYPIDVARGVTKVQGKVKAAVLSGTAFNNLFFGMNPGTNSTLVASNTNNTGGLVTGSIQFSPSEPHVVGSGSSFYAGINNTNLDTSGINGGDLGVVYAATGLPFTRVASSPTTGQYVAPVQIGTVATPTALSWTAGVATVTATTTNLQVGMVVTITGCTPSAYNGTWTVASVTGTTAFTFALPLAATPGSGTVFGSVVVNPSYQFSTGDSGASVLITYRYTVTNGQTIIINNQQLGYTPIFQLDYVTVRNNNYVAVRLFQCTASGLNIATKLEDFIMPEFSFGAFANVSNLIGQISFSQVS